VEAELNEKGIEFGRDSAPPPPEGGINSPANEISDSLIPPSGSGGANCLFIKNTTALDVLETFKKGYFEIQDRSSQQTLRFIQPRAGEHWWDACSGSGGKSLMMVDAEPSLSIYATDVRETVLQNLKERFRKIIPSPKIIVEKADVANLPANFIPPFTPDGILADVPCTGSGTWARTPEWIEMFEEESVLKYQKLQFDIVSNLVKYLPKGKPLVYITCSAFRVENEDIITNFVQNLPLKLEASEYLKGYEIGGDTMFAARLVRV